MEDNRLIKNILFYIFGYIKSLVLAWVVLPTLACILFIWTAFSATLELKWKKYFSFLNPAYTTGTFHLDGGDIMKIFGVISLVIFCITELLRVFGIKIKISLKLGFFILTIIFGFAEFLIFYPTELLSTVISSKSSDFAFIFIIVYIVTIIAYCIWYALNKITSLQK